MNEASRDAEHHPASAEMTGTAPAPGGGGRPEVDRDSFRELFDWASIGIVSSSIEGRFLAVNSAFCSMVGYSEAELLETGYAAITHPDDVAASRKLWDQVWVGEAPSSTLEKRYLRRDGETIWANVTGSVIRDDNGRPMRFMATVDDIGARKRAEEELERSQSLQRLAGGLARVGGWALDLPAMEFFGSQELQKILGEQQDGVSLADALARVPESHQEGIAAALAGCAIEGVPFDLELPMAAGDGSEIWIRVVGEAQPNDDGTIARVAGAFQDITEQRRAIAVLRDREARLADQAALLDEARDAIIVGDLDHRITFWNRGAIAIYGWTAEEAVGRSIRDLLYPDPSAFDEATGRLLRHDQWQGELTAVTKGGRQLVADCRATLVRDEAGQPRSVLVIKTDITERREREQQQLRAQRMESIGTLAGGLAHDLNNALLPVMMATDLLKSDEAHSSRLSMLETIATGTQRAADMVRQILSFAAGVEGRRLSVEVGDMLRDVERIANDTFLKTIRIVRAEAADLWPVSGDPTQLNQVLINLCLNARDAMPTGGTLVLAADNVIVDERNGALDDEPTPGRYVRIRVEDDGHGMSPEVLDRIFEPFYTTKEQGSGTGLGLSTSAGIIKSHSGFIRVDSAPGEGTRFLVHLPTADEPASATATPDPPGQPSHSGRTVLVVDDEDQVRTMLRIALERAGYRVLQATDGPEAVAVLTRAGRAIDVVLTDMMMPGMDGLETIRALRTIRPNVPTVLISGLHAQSMIDAAAKLGVRHVIAKPFTTTTLLHTLRASLGELGIAP